MEEKHDSIIVTELVNWTHTGVPTQPKTPYPNQGGSFFNRILTANKETYAETEIAQTSFSGQRMEKWEPGSQANFLTQFGQRHQIYRRVQVKEGKLESRRNTHVLSENRAVV